MTTKKKPAVKEEVFPSDAEAGVQPDVADDVSDPNDATIEVAWRLTLDARYTASADDIRPSTLEEQAEGLAADLERQIIHIVPACSSITVSGATITLNAGF